MKSLTAKEAYELSIKSRNLLNEHKELIFNAIEEQALLGNTMTSVYLDSSLTSSQLTIIKNFMKLLNYDISINDEETPTGYNRIVVRWDRESKN